ncbi:MAG: hypothetical protein DA330_05250 [Nitrososphaera sp.]|nr:hypothetical protein [Nitrososphaera sp.]
MSDYLLFSSLSFFLSWLIRQVEANLDADEPDETGIDPDEKMDAASIQMEVEPLEPLEQAIKIAIAAFSIILFGLSISAYKKTGFKKIVYAAVAFGLFAVQMLYDYLVDSIEALDIPLSDIVITSITLAILTLFFFAVVRKK